MKQKQEKKDISTEENVYNVENQKKDEKKSEKNTTKITPSYAKKKDVDTKKKVNKKVKSKITKIIILIILAILLITLVFGIYRLVLNNKYKRYEKYETQMQKYGFDKMYDNSSAETLESVTKSEMVKVVVSSILNIYDISDTWSVENKKYDNQDWVDYAQSNGFISEGKITEENESKKATSIEVLEILNNYKKNVLEKNIDIEGNPQFRDFDKYTNEEQIIIKDMVWNKIIENGEFELNAKKSIVKGELNALIIKFIEKYNIITLSEDDKLNISQDKLPYNYDIYTYTLANVKKEIYEAKFDYTDVSKSVLPKDMYIKYKQEISDWIIMIEYYYNTILNVDYTKFNKQEFADNVNAFTMYNYSNEEIEKYEQHLKENQIVVNGNVKIQMPIIYFDGQYIRIRAKVDYNIVHSNTNKNILFGDLNVSDDIVYSEFGGSTKYIDIKLVSHPNDEKTMFLTNSTLNELVVNSLN